MVGSYDITWNATDVAFWSMFECSLACIIACLPALNHLILRFLKKFTKLVTHGHETGPKAPAEKPGVLRLPVHQAEAYQRSVISNGYGRHVKHWANSSRTRSESSGGASTGWGSRSTSTATSSSTNPSTNNSSVMETTVYIIDEIPSDIEEEAENYEEVLRASLGSVKAHPADPAEKRPASSGLVISEDV
ncbi:hypothetical protein TWF481_004112 [Arthrobotrys musiformis]|uniref:Uncharacterized protein n=1 Tax=Arthrobotrys musiformis TaxID=47236 RepID=A0AAV9WK35_9PEZI